MTLNIQAPILSTSRDPLKARLKVSASSRTEGQIALGSMFVAVSERLAVPVGNVFYSVLKAAPNKYLVIEDAILELDFSAVTQGQYSFQIEGFADISNGNAWGYTPLNPVPVGRPLLASMVNDFPASTVDVGVTVNSPVLSGAADYPFFFADYFVDTQGNRVTIGSTQSTFFEKNRQVVLAPGQEMLIRSRTAGTAVGDATIRNIFFTSEIDPSVFPG